MNNHFVLALLSLGALSGCLEQPEVDLVGPTIVASSLVGPRSVEVSVVPELVIEFSEAVDPATIQPGSVALVAWDPLDSCALTPVCLEGSCERGRCQTSPLTKTDRSEIDRGEFERGIPIDLTLELGLAGPSSRLRIRPRRALLAHHRHTLVVGASVRDRSGAALSDDTGQFSAWQRDFVTAGRGSGGPEPALVRPQHGTTEVPTNLATIDTELWPPVPMPQPDATLWLEPDDHDGDQVELVDPIGCPGWPLGTCLRWRPATELAAQTRYRVAGGTLIDRHGRATVRPGVETEAWFASASEPDLEPPHAEVIAELRGRCVALWVDAGEPIEATLSVVGVEQRRTLGGAGWIGVGLDEPVESPLAWSLSLRDLAENHAELDGPLELTDAIALPELRLTEILANPLGPEPDAEFIEIQAGPDGATLDGVHVADASLAEVRAAWLAGGPLGDPLPPITLEPAEIALIVARDYGLESSADPAPPASTRLLVVDASLGAGGLENVGAPVTLWIDGSDGPAAIASYSNWIDTSASAHAGRSVVGSPDGCDLPDRWASHPLGRATPGLLP